MISIEKDEFLRIVNELGLHKKQWSLNEAMRVGSAIGTLSYSTVIGAFDKYIKPNYENTVGVKEKLCILCGRNLGNRYIDAKYCDDCSRKKKARVLKG